jgi:hypothetical protein
MYIITKTMKKKIYISFFDATRIPGAVPTEVRDASLPEHIHQIFGDANTAIAAGI